VLLSVQIGENESISHQRIYFKWKKCEKGYIKELLIQKCGVFIDERRRKYLLQTGKNVNSGDSEKVGRASFNGNFFRRNKRSRLHKQCRLSHGLMFLTEYYKQNFIKFSENNTIKLILKTFKCISEMFKIFNIFKKGGTINLRFLNFHVNIPQIRSIANPSNLVSCNVIGSVFKAIFITSCSMVRHAIVAMLLVLGTVEKIQAHKRIE
jgi:hypothetical protein